MGIAFILQRGIPFDKRFDPMEEALLPAWHVVPAYTVLLNPYSTSVNDYLPV